MSAARKAPTDEQMGLLLKLRDFLATTPKNVEAARRNGEALSALMEYSRALLDECERLEEQIRLYAVARPGSGP